MENKKFTVVIPTYNRKTELLECLKALEVQGNYDKYDLIISNNKSNYDVEEWVKHAVNKRFFDIITIYNRPFNVGGDINIAESFQLPKTQWMWLTSDDDIPEPDAISTILNDIEEHPDVCWIKYSISGKYKSFKDRKTNDVISFFSEFSSTSHSMGEMIFMSNNLYNLKELRDYIGDAPFYASSCMSQLVPPLRAIINDQKYMMFSHKCLTNYVGGRISYNSIYANVGLGNFIYTNIFLNDLQIKSFRKVLCMMPRTQLVPLFNIRNKVIRKYLFKKFFLDRYPSLSLEGLHIYIIYYLLSLLPYSILEKILVKRLRIS